MQSEKTPKGVFFLEKNMKMTYTETKYISLVVY